MKRIVKGPAAGGVRPNLPDYDQVRAEFDWERARAELDGLDGGINIAYEAVDGHALGTRAQHVALRWIPKSGPAQDLSYAELGRQTNRFANVLRSLDVDKRDSVFLLAGRVPRCTWRRSGP